MTLKINNIMERKEFETKFEVLAIKNILPSEILKESKTYFYQNNLVELIGFNPDKITYTTRFFNYLRYMKESVNDYTVKNILGYTILSHQYYIVLEKVKEEKSLTESIKSYNFIEKLKIAIELCEMIYYFHNTLKITLKILSASNIFIQEGKLKINVSHLQRIVHECSIDNHKKEILYYEYLPPDLFDLSVNDEDGDIDYKKEGNIWSLGCIISEIFSGFIPWHNHYSKNEMIIIKLLAKKTNFPIPDNIKQIHNDIYKIVEDCTNLNADLRPKIEEIMKILKTILQNKDKIYTLLFSFNSNKSFKGMKKKYLVVSFYKFL